MSNKIISGPVLPEIDEHTSKLIVGAIALSLAWLTNHFSDTPLQSISASYHEGGLSRDIFVGFVCAIAAFLFSYNGKEPFQHIQMWLTKIGAVAALGIAFFPCKCGNHTEIIPYVHGISTIVLFTILAVFCGFFYKRAMSKRIRDGRQKLRARIYAACGTTIIATIIILSLDFIFDGIFSSRVSRLTFYGEKASLLAFGVAWLTASQILPLVTRKDVDRLPFFYNRAAGQKADKAGSHPDG